MTKKISQAYVAPEIEFFKKDFLKINNLTEYNNEYEPVVFFGAKYSSDLINKHRGYKLILPNCPNDIPKITDYTNTFLICSDNYKNLPSNVIRKSITPRIKEYDIFKPNTLGNKIYVYTGFKNGWNLRNDPIINEIQKNIDFEIITTAHSTIKDYLSIDSLKFNFYDKCFLNLNFTKGHGLTTAIELGLMGRKTVFKNTQTNNFQRIEFPNFISYENINDIINIINIESKKIGTIQPRIDAHNVGDEWLDLEFWL